ncbi:membrane hypothetical protein [uncultured Desulfobacterium sp.]|uniref:Uncharacterized protein n=1 Tax=uncultured Desulfobacterium sp. TaxID=201089 RepID=A0A445MUI3_9BACT|nr:membrane hypothetical protein [uncultured Desulfobacterium sp.]
MKPTRSKTTRIQLPPAVLKNRRIPWRVIGYAIVLCLLWAMAYQVFQVPSEPMDFRIDRREAIAYPMSDAAGDFLNGLALLVGDGWVNWRPFARWTVYRPGWCGFIGVLTWLCDYDLPRIQTVLTAIYALAAPLFFLLCLAVFRGGSAPAVAFIAAVFFTMHPQDRSWWFQSTMMTEGPTLLLALGICLFSVRAASRRCWRWGEGFILGILLGAIILVRNQSLYAFAALFAVLCLQALRRFRRRFPFLIMLLCGLFCTVGPCFFKTSWHLKQPYFGTNCTSLTSILGWSATGRLLGGFSLTPEEEKDEATAINVMTARAKKAILMNLKDPKRVLSEAFVWYERTNFVNMAKMLGLNKLATPTIVMLWLLMLAGVFYAFVRHGLTGIIPFAFSVGYFFPQVLISFYMDRFAQPIFWVGLFYITGGLLFIFSHVKRNLILRRLRICRVMIRWVFKRLTGIPAPKNKKAVSCPLRPVWPRATILAAFSIWFGGCSAGLLWMDYRPVRTVEASALLADERTQSTLHNAGIKNDDALLTQVEQALHANRQNKPVRIAYAVLPFIMEPTDKPFKYIWDPDPGLQPHQERYTAVYCNFSWKRNSKWAMERINVRGNLYPDFKQGDEVVVIEQSGGVYADAIIPTKWAKR